MLKIIFDEFSFLWHRLTGNQRKPRSQNPCRLPLAMKVDTIKTLDSISKHFSRKCFVFVSFNKQILDLSMSTNKSTWLRMFWMERLRLELKFRENIHSSNCFFLSSNSQFSCVLRVFNLDNIASRRKLDSFIYILPCLVILLLFYLFSCNLTCNPCLCEWHF